MQCYQINLALMGDHFSWMKHSFLEENNVDKVLRKSLVDGLVNFESDEATSKIVDDGTPAARSRLAKREPGKRTYKTAECWLAY